MMYLLASSFILSWIFTTLIVGIVLTYATENEPRDLEEEEI